MIGRAEQQRVVCHPALIQRCQDRSDPLVQLARTGFESCHILPSLWGIGQRYGWLTEAGIFCGARREVAMGFGKTN